MDYLDRLACFAHDTTLAALEAPVVAAARHVLLDTVGAILAGSRLVENARLARLLAERSGPRTATLVGHAAKAEPMLATLANATAGVALEMDEGNRWGGGHPGIHVVPAALAVAEELGIGGARLLESVVAGYEVTSHLGGATEVRPDVHSHGTWGTIGAAVAVAKLHALAPGETREVINLAASMSPANSWTPCFEGATVRNLYPGRSGFQGILAVHLLRCGFTGPRDAPADVHGTILGDAFDRARAVEGLGAEYRIRRNYFKLHACCLYNHPALDAVQALVRAEGFGPDDVRRVTVTSVPFVTRMARPDPGNMLAARFSVPYAVAAAIVHARTDVPAFAEAAVTDPTVRALARKVDVRADPAMSMRRSGHPTAEVSIVLADGRVLSRATTAVRGDAENPVSPDELAGKFLTLAGDALGEAGAKRVADTILGVEGLGDVRELTALLGGGTA